MKTRPWYHYSHHTLDLGLFYGKNQYKVLQKEPYIFEQLAGIIGRFSSCKKCLIEWSLFCKQSSQSDCHLCKAAFLIMGNKSKYDFDILNYSRMVLHNAHSYAWKIIFLTMKIFLINIWKAKRFNATGWHLSGFV